MKTNRILLAAFFMLLFFPLRAQLDRDDHLTLLFYQAGSVSYQSNPNLVPKTTLKENPPNHFMGRLYFLFDVEARNWVSADVSFFGALVNVAAQGNNWKNTANVGFVELGFGRMLNNKRPIRFGGNTDMLLGLGFNLGARGLAVGQNRFAKTMGVGIGPAFATDIQIGSRLHLFTVAELAGLWGADEVKAARFKCDAVLTFKVLNWLGVTLTPNYESYNFNRGNERRDIYKFKTIQLGITVNNIF